VDRADNERRVYYYRLAVLVLGITNALAKRPRLRVSLRKNGHTHCYEDFSRTAMKMFAVARDGSGHTGGPASHGRKSYDLEPLRSIWRHHICVDARSQHTDLEAMGLPVCDGKRRLAALPISRTLLSISESFDGISLPILGSTHHRLSKIQKPWN
jgi:hypothetical protein